jgi:hypothetical protein
MIVCTPLQYQEPWLSLVIQDIGANKQNKQRFGVHQLDYMSFTQVADSVCASGRQLCGCELSSDHVIPKHRYVHTFPETVHALAREQGD